MEPILFYGVPEGCSFGSIVALEWSRQPYRLCRIEMPRVVSGEAYRRINPVGETPTLRTADGRYLSESAAVLQHIGERGLDAGLASRHGTPEGDRLNEVLAFLNTSFFHAFQPLWWALEHGQQGQEKAVLTAFGKALVRKAHANLERLLRAGPWLAGERKTIADAYFMGIARWNDFHQVLDRRDYPSVHRLHERLLADAAVKFAHAIEHEQPARSSGGFLGHVALDDVLAAA